jgi:hypothetical protein
LALIGAAVLSISCVSLPKDGVEQPPEITSELSVDECVQAGMRFGGVTLETVKKRFHKNKEWPAVHKLTAKLLRSPDSKMVNREFLQLVNMYQSSLKNLDEGVFLALIRSESDIQKQAGWQLAANFPEPKVAQWVDRELSIMLESGTEEKNLFPQLAHAVQANRVKAAYSMMRMALLKSGVDDFAKAMAALDPIRASNDFFDYLALANPEDLRQMTQTTVNVFTCMFIMKHYLAYPADINHPKSEMIFYYSISRNNGLADIAKDVVQYGLNGSVAHIAQILARMPSWVQVAFVEGVRTSQDQKLKLVLAELQLATSEQDVADEIVNILR